MPASTTIRSTLISVKLSPLATSRSTAASRRARASSRRASRSAGRRRVTLGIGWSIRSDMLSGHDVLGCPAMTVTTSAAANVDWDALIHEDRVHGSLYTDPAVWAAELEQIWYRTWVYVGHTSEVPATNDYVLKAIGPQPVIM